MFFDTLSALCQMKGISTYKACTDIGLNRAAVGKWKKGTIPNGTTLSKLADYFNVTTDYLLTGEEKEKPPVDDERFLPLDERREALSKAGIHILLDADAKVTEEQLDDIISFIEIQQRRNGR